VIFDAKFLFPATLKFSGHSIFITVFQFLFLESVIAISFDDTTNSAGISSDHHSTYIITGQAWGDFDNDGHEDLYLTDNDGPNTLYRNLGDGTFQVSSLTAQVALTSATSGGATFVDFDNDGDQDLLVLNHGVDSFFENTGTSFTDITAGSGIVQPGEGESAAWGDFNQDGYLDFYVANWYYTDPGDPLSQDIFYLNNGNGTFTDISYLLDIDRMMWPAFAVTFLDYDNDGDLDIFVVNDKLWGNLLWRNDGAGCDLWCFTDVSMATGAHHPVQGMGIAIADIDLDGDFDFFMSSEWEQALLRSEIAQGSDSFTDISDAAGVNFDAIGWGPVFVDFDNDGWEDLYLATQQADAARANRLYWNNGNGTFFDWSGPSGASLTGPTIGVAYADYDQDGRIDLVMGNQHDSYYLFRNTSSAGNWLSIKLEGRAGINRDAVGTLAVLELSDGRVLRRLSHIGSSIGSDHQSALHFGMGGATPVELTLTWPDGTEEVFDTLPINQQIEFLFPLSETIFKTSFE